MAVKAKEKNPPVLAIVVLLFAALGGAAYWWLTRDVPPAQPPALTAEAKAYVRHLALSEVEMKATESYVGQRVVEIVGKITNNGPQAVSVVEINCVFHDPYGQLVLRERTPIVRSKTGGLKPGETKSFRLPFDSIPESWNRAMPQLVIARIVFG